jgi:hypothetical protein
MTLRGLKSQRFVAATATGFNVTAVNSAVAAGTTVDCENLNQLTLFCTYTRSAGTGLQFNIELSDDGTTFYKMQTTSVAGGTVTGSDLLVLKTISSTASFTVNLSIQAKSVRLAAVVATGSPDANDKATISMMLGSL